MTPLLRKLLLPLILLALLAAAQAQEQAPAPGGGEAEEAPARAETEAGPEAEEAAAEDAVPIGSGPSTEPFRPSEEISEDLSVSFPVDI